MRRQGVGLAGLLILVVLLVAVANLSLSAKDKESAAAQNASIAPTKAQLELARKATAILDRRCDGGCHRVLVARGKTTSWGQSVPYLIQTHRVVPGDPDKSRLYSYTGMAGTHKIPADERKTVHDWIEQGAIDPKAPPTPASKPTTNPTSKPTSEPASDPATPLRKDNLSWRHM